MTKVFVEQPLALPGSAKDLPPKIQSPKNITLISLLWLVNFNFLWLEVWYFNLFNNCVKQKEEKKDIYLYTIFLIVMKETINIYYSVEKQPLLNDSSIISHHLESCTYRKVNAV